MRLSFQLRILLALALWTVGGFLLVHGLSVELLQYFPFISRWSRSAGLIVFAGGVMLTGFTFGKSGISRLNQLRKSLAAVRDGRAARVDGKYPLEVQPLVDDLNSLLDRREQDVRRAQTKAADLAHGLKTPLSLLEREAEDARARGESLLAERISEQIERMRRRIDYHLAHARAAASGPMSGARTSLHEALSALARALNRLYPDKGVTIDLDVPAEQTIRCERQDVDEMLGNLLDNACKWAAARVTVGSSVDGGMLTITVDDDGPGLPGAQMAEALRRGVQLDDSAEGTGIGLAIVADLAGLYGGTIELDASPLGGLRASLTLPA
jgi:signal transduction histidine kinase